VHVSFSELLNVFRYKMDGTCSTNVDIRNPYNILVGKPEGNKNHSENLGIDGRIILEWILEK